MLIFVFYVSKFLIRRSRAGALYRLYEIDRKRSTLEYGVYCIPRQIWGGRRGAIASPWRFYNIIWREQNLIWLGISSLFVNYPNFPSLKFPSGFPMNMCAIFYLFRYFFKKKNYLTDGVRVRRVKDIAIYRVRSRIIVEWCEHNENAE